MPTFYFLHKYAYVGNIIKLKHSDMNNLLKTNFPTFKTMYLKLTKHSTAIAAVTIVTGQLTSNQHLFNTGLNSEIHASNFK